MELMKRAGWIATLLITLSAAGRGLAIDHDCCPPPQEGIFKRCQPVGGWAPYGGGLLRWWNPHCFPRCGAPDDYCRKNLPCVCWPPHPPYYIEGPSEICHSQGSPSAHSGC